MNIENRIRKWRESGIVSGEQAQRMLVDISSDKKEEGSSRFIATISIIGATFLGLGALLFIASGWHDMSDATKVILLLGSTMGATYAGYLLKYGTRSLPRAGGALFFLGAILFGVSTFLIARIYQVEANAHYLILIWLIGILPLVFAFRSESIAALTAVLFYVWMTFFIFRNYDPSGYIYISLPKITLVASALLFGLSGLLGRRSGMRKVARPYELASLKIGMLSLFLLTFEYFSVYEDRFLPYKNPIYGQLNAGIWIFSLLAFGALTASYRLDQDKPGMDRNKNLIFLGLLTVMLFSFVAFDGGGFHFVYTLLFIPTTLSLFYFGYRNSDIELVNIGSFYLTIFVLAKYLEYISDFLGGSVSFIISGTILIASGIFLEKKRRQIKEKIVSRSADKPDAI